MNKHQIVLNWVNQYLATDPTWLYFENIEMYPGARTLVPNFGDYKLSEDVLGNIKKRYTFSFIGIEDFSTNTDNINIDGFTKFDKFNDWVIEQNNKGNFPDFGPNTFDCEIEPLQNMSNLAMISEDGNLAKYMLAIQIDYTEREEE